MTLSQQQRSLNTRPPWYDHPMAKKPKLTLTPLQARFVVEYAIDQNGTKAAIRAGYAESSAHAEASRQLKIVKVRQEIAKELNKHLANRGVKVRTVVNRLDDLATVDPAECFGEGNHVLTIHDIPPDVRRCIKEITVREEWGGQGRDKKKVAELVTVKFYDRVKANELLGRHLKMFTDKVEVKHKHTLESLVAQAGERDVTESPRLLPDAGDEEE